MLYLVAEAVHIISVICWMAGLLYVPRLYVYHAGKEHGSELHDTFCTMERRLLFYITTPAAVSAVITGLFLAIYSGIITNAGWLHTKLLLVFVLLGFHFYLFVLRKLFLGGTTFKTSRFFRFLNEVPTVLMVLIVLLAVIKP